MTRIKLAALAATALLSLTGAAEAQVVAITGGKVATGTGGDPVEGATVLIRDGRIVAVGPTVAVPAGAQMVDARGKWVTPGLFAGFSRLGIVEVDGVDEVNDAGANRAAFAASLDVSTAVNPASTPIAITRANGVTRAVTAPDNGKDIFEGQGAIIALADRPDIVMRPRAFQYVELGEGGSRRAGGSRPAAIEAFRNGLDEAIEYARNPKGYEGGKERESILPRRDAAALVQVVEGRQPIVIRAERASDIREVIALRRDYPKLRIILLGASEGWLVAREIAAAGLPVIALSMENLPGRFETLAATMSNVGRMTAAGVKVGLGVPDLDASFQPRLLPQYAGNMVAQGRVPGGVGLSWGQALASISRVPAEIFGMGGEVGTLEPGKRADVVVWDGDPLELTSAPTAVWIDGQPASLENRQTKLRDRYLNLQQGALPVQYKR